MRTTLKILLILSIVLISSCRKQNNFPIELTYSFEYLDTIWNDEQKEEFKNIDVNKPATKDYHFGIGLHLRNNLLRHNEKSEIIVKYFNDLGIEHYDYMSGLILHSYHRYLNNQENDIQEKVDEILENEKPRIDCEKKLKERELLLSEKYSINDTILIKMPVNKNKNAFIYGCPWIDWKFNDNKDISIKGLVLDKKTKFESKDIYLKIKILDMSKEDVKILMEDLNVGDDFEISLSDSLIFE